MATSSISSQNNFITMPNKASWSPTAGSVPDAVKRLRLIAGGLGIGEDGGVMVGRDVPVSGFRALPQIHFGLQAKPFAPPAGKSDFLRAGNMGPITNYTASVDRYDIMFTKKRVRLTNPTISDPDKSMLSLQALNFLLHKWTAQGSIPSGAMDVGGEAIYDEDHPNRLAELVPEFPETTRHGMTVTEGVDVNDPEQMMDYVMDNWGLSGVVNNQSGEGKREDGVRTLNLVRMGRYDVPNIFGERVVGTHYLRLLVKMVPVTGETTTYFPDPNQAPQILPNKTVIQERDGDGNFTGRQLTAKMTHVCRIVGCWTTTRDIPVFLSDVPERFRRTVETNKRGECREVPLAGHGVLEHEYRPAGAPDNAACERVFARPIHFGIAEVNRAKKERIRNDLETNILGFRSAPKVDCILQI